MKAILQDCGVDPGKLSPDTLSFGLSLRVNGMDDSEVRHRPIESSEATGEVGADR